GISRFMTEISSREYQQPRLYQVPVLLVTAGSLISISSSNGIGSIGSSPTSLVDSVEPDELSWGEAFLVTSLGSASGAVDSPLGSAGVGCNSARGRGANGSCAPGVASPGAKSVGFSGISCRRATRSCCG